jgi:hypothetical protein
MEKPQKRFIPLFDYKVVKVLTALIPAQWRPGKKMAGEQCPLTLVLELPQNEHHLGLQGLIKSLLDILACPRFTHLTTTGTHYLLHN